MGNNLGFDSVDLDWITLTLRSPLIKFMMVVVMIFEIFMASNNGRILKPRSVILRSSGLSFHHRRVVVAVTLIVAIARLQMKAPAAVVVAGAAACSCIERGARCKNRTAAVDESAAAASRTGVLAKLEAVFFHLSKNSLMSKFNK